jgi:hypothetical protein
MSCHESVWELSDFTPRIKEANDWIKETEVTHAKPKPYTLNPKLVNDWIKETEVTHPKNSIDSVEAGIITVECAAEPSHSKIVSELHDITPDVAWFRVQGSGFRVQGSGFRVQDSGFRVQGLGFRVQVCAGDVGRAFKIECSGGKRGCKTNSDRKGTTIQGLGFRV